LTHVLHAIGGLLSVYLLGWVVGALLVDSRFVPAEAVHKGDQPGARSVISWAVVRLIAGLLLSALAFLLSLVLALPWFVGPATALGAAVAIHGRLAFAVPRPNVRYTSYGVAALLLAVVLQGPVFISALRMAPGPFPPVFFHVDTPYTLEKVQSLTKTRVYPPESLSNAGGRPQYHYAVHGLAALLSRTSGLTAHHSLFLVVLPLLAAGSIAAAFLVARSLGPAVASSIAVPLLLLRVPSPWYTFWDIVGPLLAKAWSTGSWGPIDTLAANYEVWGPASIVGHNVGAEFVVLASLAALATAPTRGWRLAAFLIGTAIMVKVPTGVALLSGFFLVQVSRMLAVNGRALAPAIAVAAVCAATYLAFFVLTPVTQTFKVTPWPFFHLDQAQEHGRLLGLAADLVWVLVPVALASRLKGSGRSGRSLWLLLLALAPLVVVNLTSSVDARPGGSGEPTDDWVQALVPAPMVLHAFVLAFISGRWTALGRLRRLAIVAFLVLTILPPVLVTGRYLGVLLFEPERGHEFADNRSIAAALATIPVRGSVIVTNDLRYPAGGFSRNNRQMQVPALFGHQAFAVNYAYERFEFSKARMELHAPLQRNEWSDDILAAARAHGWTHFLVRKDYTHPDTIPLEQTFANADYAVYRFANPTARSTTAGDANETGRRARPRRRQWPSSVRSHRSPPRCPRPGAGVLVQPASDRTDKQHRKSHGQAARRTSLST
jgi:hypothetical protein